MRLNVQLPSPQSPVWGKEHLPMVAAEADPTLACLKQALTQVSDHTMTHCVSCWSPCYLQPGALRMWIVLQEQRPLGIYNLGDAPPQCHVQAYRVLHHPSLPPRCARTAEPWARALHPSKPEMASPLGTTLASSQSSCLMHFDGFLRTTQRAHRLVCFDFPLAFYLSFVFSIK